MSSPTTSKTTTTFAGHEEQEADPCARRYLRLWDTVGYLAAGLVVMAFCMKDMMWLRVVALTSNVLFLVYGVGLGLVPVWLLHAILLPVNGWRLWQGICCRCIGRREFVRE